MNTQDFPRKAQSLSISGIQGPVTAPSQMKENQKSEFQVIHTLHLTEPLYIVEKHKESRNFEHFQLEYPKSSTLQDESKTHTPKFEKFRQINVAYYILDACMHWIHTCVTQNTQNLYPFYANHAPSAHLKTTQEEFSQSNCSCKILNQFEPVLASAELQKILKFPTFTTNFTHCYFEFLKDFYIFRISGPSGSIWYEWLQDSFSINGEKYCPQEMVVSIQFILHGNPCNSLINNIKTIFL